MHDLAPLIRDLAILLSIAGIATLLFQKIRQPVVLGYLVAGVIIGPYTPPYVLVSDIPNIQTLSELGVIFLMFSLGLDFTFHKLKRVGFSATLVGLFEVIFMLAVGIIVGRIIGWTFYDSVFLGAALAISSTTIIIKALEELQLKTKQFAEVVFGVLIVEDLLAILLLVGLSVIVATNNIFSMEIIGAAAKLLLVVGGWFLVGYFLVPSFFRKVMKHVSEETLTIVSVALCLLLVCVATYFHYSPALGAFIMGSILAETPLVHKIENLTKPIKNIFAAVFFVSVGMLINPFIIWQHLPVVLLICGVTILGKFFTMAVGSFFTGQSVNNSLRIGFSMAQVGEFSFIIVGLGVALHVTSDLLYPIIVAVSLVTTFTTPYFIQFSGYLTNKMDQRLSTKTKYWLGSYASWLYRLTSTSKQQSFYRKAMVRFLINGLIVAIIFTMVKELGLNQLIPIVGNLRLSEITAWFIATLFSLPFIWGMIAAFQSKRYTENQSREGFLFYVGCVLVLLEISALSLEYFNTWFIALILFMVVGFIFSILYRNLEKSYYWFEKHLVGNLGAIPLQKKRYEELAPWDTRFVEWEVHRNSALINKLLKTLKLRQNFGINIIAIQRGDEVILSPRGMHRIHALDKLILLGNDDQIDAFNKAYPKVILEDESFDILEKFSIKTISVDEEKDLIGQTIRDSNIRELMQGLVLGIERRGMHLLNPDSETLIEKGDLIFVVGRFSDAAG